MGQFPQGFKSGGAERYWREACWFKILAENTQNSEKWRVNSDAREFATFFQLPVQDSNWTVKQLTREFVTGPGITLGRRPPGLGLTATPSERP